MKRCSSFTFFTNLYDSIIVIMDYGKLPVVILCYPIGSNRVRRDEAQLWGTTHGPNGKHRLDPLRVNFLNGPNGPTQWGLVVPHWGPILPIGPLVLVQLRVICAEGGTFPMGLMSGATGSTGAIGANRSLGPLDTMAPTRTMNGSTAGPLYPMAPMNPLCPQ